MKGKKGLSRQIVCRREEKERGTNIGRKKGNKKKAETKGEAGLWRVGCGGDKGRREGPAWRIKDKAMTKLKRTARKENLPVKTACLAVREEAQAGRTTDEAEPAGCRVFVGSVGRGQNSMMIIRTMMMVVSV